MQLSLYDYWRSGAAYRVRIGLNLKGLDYASRPVDLRRGEQQGEAFCTVNPQGLVPVLEVDGRRLTQSLAILEFLDELHPAPPLLPADALARAEVRGLCLAVAADTHPLHNLRVGGALKRDFAATDAQVQAWNRRWIGKGLQALEAGVDRLGGGWCVGDQPGMLDCLLMPLLYSARRFGEPVEPYGRLLAVEGRATAHPAFAAAHPDRQPDRPPDA